MIGNDIVDLTLAQQENNWRRKGFLDKIFTKNEQIQIQNSINPEIKIWELWSRKEAAYKIYNRQTGIRQFIPFKINCTNIKCCKNYLLGKVIIENSVYYTKTIIQKDCINTISVLNISDFKKVKVSNQSIKIYKINNIPYYFNDNEMKLKPASISHHGKYSQTILI